MPGKLPLELSLMDNLTHSLLGASVAEAVGRRKEARPWYWFISILANNAPDSDIIIPLFFGERKITGLLHHRGHTHTYLVSFLLAVLCYGVVLGVAKLFGKRFSKKEKQMLFGLALAGNVLHILADSCNSYGVHPFWPLDNSWHFGDLVFIIEPWIWLLLASALLVLVKSRAAKIFFGLVLAGAIGIVWKAPLFHWPTSLLISTSAFGLPFLYRKISEKRRVWAALGTIAFVLLIFSVGKVAVRKKVTELHPSNLFDAAITPYPGDPFCWNLEMLVINGNDYRIQRATVAPFPKIFSTATCPKFPYGETLAPLMPVPESSNRTIIWHGEFRGQVSDLRKIAAQSCKASALLRFMRMPFWIIEEGQWILGDLRFDRSRELGFTKFALDPKDTKCPPAVPPWEAPLAPLIH